jgi:hypothetical protein
MVHLFTLVATSLSGASMGPSPAGRPDADVRGVADVVSEHLAALGAGGSTGSAAHLATLASIAAALVFIEGFGRSRVYTAASRLRDQLTEDVRTAVDHTRFAHRPPKGADGNDAGRDTRFRGARQPKIAADCLAGGVLVLAALPLGLAGHIAATGTVVERLLGGTLALIVLVVIVVAVWDAVEARRLVREAYADVSQEQLGCIAGRLWEVETGTHRVSGTLPSQVQAELAMRLLHVNALLAMTKPRPARVAPDPGTSPPRAGDDDRSQETDPADRVTELEQWADYYDALLPLLKRRPGDPGGEGTTDGTEMTRAEAEQEDLRQLGEKFELLRKRSDSLEADVKAMHRTRAFYRTELLASWLWARDRFEPRLREARADSTETAGGATFEEVVHADVLADVLTLLKEMRRTRMRPSPRFCAPLRPGRVTADAFLPQKDDEDVEGLRRAWLDAITRDPVVQANPRHLLVYAVRQGCTPSEVVDAMVMLEVNDIDAVLLARSAAAMHSAEGVQAEAQPEEELKRLRKAARKLLHAGALQTPNRSAGVADGPADMAGALATHARGEAEGAPAELAQQEAEAATRVWEVVRRSYADHDDAARAALLADLKAALAALRPPAGETSTPGDSSSGGIPVHPATTPTLTGS